MSLEDLVGLVLDWLPWLVLGIGIGGLGYGLLTAFNLRRLTWLSPGDVSDGPFDSLSVIVPARNEEEDIERCLRSILEQREVELEVIVVNDHSSDRTPAIADALAAEDPRVRVLHDPPLADGWLGKANAMRVGLERARHDLVLFSDADIIHSPGCIRAGLGERRRRDLDLVSLFPRFEFRGLWEHALLPGMVSWMGLYLRPAMERPGRAPAGAAGAFLMVRREALEDVGGLAVIRQTMLDDVDLARIFKKRGKRVGFCPAPTLLRVRMFKTAADAFWGPTKNVLAVTPGGVLGLAGGIPAVTATLWLPPIAAVLGAVQRDPWLALAGVVAVALHAAALTLPGPVFRIRPLLLVGYLLHPLPLVACAVRAVYHRVIRRAVLWRDRSLRTD